MKALSVKWLMIVVLAALAACSGSIETKHDPQVDFSKYKTFCWMNGCTFHFQGLAPIQDSVLQKRIELAIVQELEAKGLRLDSNEPDLLVGVTVTLKDEQAVIYHRADQGMQYRPLETREEVITYLKGTLVLGMVDRRDSKVVWESFATRYMDVNPDLSEENIRKGVRIILEDYPPKADKEN